MLLSSLIMAAASTLGCQPVHGFADAIETSKARWIVAGELHGTNEMPEMFANLVCIASRSAPIVVAVEQSEEDQVAIDTFINSDGGPEAEGLFLRAGMWRRGQPDSVLDGRSSQATFRLFKSLWKEHRNGRVTRVIAFEPRLVYEEGAFRMPWLGNRPTDHKEYEKRMATLLRDGAATAKRTLVLTGSAHAMRIPMKGYPTLRPVASYLPRRQTLTIRMVAHRKGRAWNCLESGCGVHDADEMSQPHRGFVADGRPGQPYDGSIFLGVPLSPSAPQR